MTDNKRKRFEPQTLKTIFAKKTPNQKTESEPMRKKTYKKPSLTVEELSDALLLANEQLRETNDKLMAAERFRTEMFGNISHDLRSPITAIRSSIEYLSSINTMEKSELDPLLKLMNTRIISLENLINDLFLLTTLDNISIDLNFTTIELGMFLEDYYYSCEADKKYENRELILDVPEDFQIPVHIDTEKITRVLDNLFTNALKYSKDGSSITLGAYTEKNEVFVFVRDTGIGIPKDVLKRIFESSYTVSSSRTPGSASGCGLGLAIAESILRRHDGRIWCESEQKKGSTFTFALPLQLTK